MSEDGREPWPVLDSDVEFSTAFFDVGYDLVERPDGAQARYWWVDPGDAVSVVARDGDDVVLVEQYRPRYREWMLEVPMGGVEGGESFEAAARRELSEETGYTADTVALLDTYDGGGWLRRTRAVVFATDLVEGEQNLDEGEFISVSRAPVATVLDRIRDRPHNPGTLAPLLLAREESLL